MFLCEPSFLQIFVRELYHHSFVISVVSLRNSVLGRTAPSLMSESKHKRLSSLEDHFADNSLKRAQSHLSIRKHSLPKANPLSCLLFFYDSLCWTRMMYLETSKYQSPVFDTCPFRTPQPLCDLCSVKSCTDYSFI